MSMFVHKVQSCFETFCMSDFSRFLNSVNLYHAILYNCNKKRHYCNYVRINFIKKVKLHQHARWAVLLIYFDCRGAWRGDWHLTNTFGFLSCKYSVLLQVCWHLCFADHTLDMSAITWAANECHWSCRFSVCHVPPPPQPTSVQLTQPHQPVTSYHTEEALFHLFSSRNRITWSALFI